MRRMFLGMAIAAAALASAWPAMAATSADYYQAGLRYYNQKQYADAARYFQAAVQVDPNNWQAYQGLSFSDYALGDRAGALSAADQSLRINPNNPGLRRFADSLRGQGGSPSSAGSPSNPGPVIGGGNFGLGLVVGDPGTFGATGKYWMDDKNAFQGDVKVNGGTLLQFDYLWHDYDLIHPSRGAMPFYIGIGGDLAVGGGSVALAVNAPIGLTYLFQKRDVPIDIFVQVEPTLTITGGVDFFLYGNLGSRFYF